MLKKVRKVWQQFFKPKNQITELSEIEEIEEMKYILFGLGNIGDKYAETRHNIGFKFLDYLAQQNNVSFKSDRFGMYASFKFKGRSIHMIKPDTYMNLSGNCVQFWVNKLKTPHNKMVVITDDLNLPFGQLRLKAKGSHGGHNGLRNIEEVLKTSQYPRLRFGISDAFEQGKQIDYVLSDWSEQERKIIPELFKKMEAGLETYYFRGIGMAMNELNTKPKKEDQLSGDQDG